MSGGFVYASHSAHFARTGIAVRRQRRRRSEPSRSGASARETAQSPAPPRPKPGRFAAGAEQSGRCGEGGARGTARRRERGSVSRPGRRRAHCARIAAFSTSCSKLFRAADPSSAKPRGEPWPEWRILASWRACGNWPTTKERTWRHGKPLCGRWAVAAQRRLHDAFLNVCAGTMNYSAAPPPLPCTI